MATGGAQRVLLDQARWFQARGHRVIAAFLYDKEGLREQWKAEIDAPLVDLNLRRPGGGMVGRVYGFLGGLLRLWSLLKQERFEVIETFTYDSNLLVLPLAWMAGVPVRIATHHGKVEDVPQWRERAHVLIVRNFASAMVAVSDDVCEQLVSIGMDRHRVFVIPNGISLTQPNLGEKSAIRRKLGAPEVGIVLISVGRLVYQKAHRFLIDALQYPGVKEKPIALYIAGEGSLRAELETQIRALNMSQEVHLLGNRSDVPMLLALSDIFVLSSRWEGLPMALLEAMGAGLPVVATRVEGVQDVVQDGVQGLLVPPEDAKALAEALIQLIDDPPLRNRMGVEARRRIESHYTTDIMCEKYLDVMLNCFTRRKSGQKSRE